MYTVPLYSIVFLFCGYIFKGAFALPSGELNVLEYRNVVTIPDIHGDSEALQRSLWISLREVDYESQITYEEFHGRFRAALLDLKAPVVPISTAADDTVLIQLGDIFDRGPNGLNCLMIVDNIERVIGWKTLKMYGNHELMNHLGIHMDYLHPAEPAKFTKYFKRPDARQTVFQAGGQLWRTMTKSTLLMVRIGDDLIPSYTPGSPQELPSLDSPSALFVHGGIETHWIDEVRHQHLPDTPSSGLIDALNALTQKVFTDQPLGPSTSSDFDFASYLGYSVRQSPLWIRDLTELNLDYVCSQTVPAILRYFGVARLIVGHTPQMKMKSLCNSRVILADASMSRWMRQTDWSITDESDPPKKDSQGNPILGNPCALIASQSDGELGALRAIYWDLNTMEKSSDMFYPASGIMFSEVISPVPPAFRPVSTSAPPSGRFGLVSVQSESIGFKVDAAKAPMIERVRRSDLRQIFGIPQILHANQNLVVLDTHGIEISPSNVRITLSFVRQIIQVFKDIESLALGLDFESERILELFILESGTGLVKLADFSKLVYYDRWSPIETKLGQVCSALSSFAHIPAGGDIINYWRIVLQVFPNAIREKFDRGSGRIAPAYNVHADVSDSGMWLQNVADSSVIVEDNGLVVLGITHIARISDLGREPLYKATRESEQSWQILLHLSAMRSASGKIAAEISHIHPREAPGPEGSAYILFSHGGEMLSDVYDKLHEERDVIAHGILAHVENLHESKILLGVSRSDVLNFFVYDDGKVFLVDISRLRHERGASECKDEMAIIIKSIEKSLKVEILDNLSFVSIDTSSVNSVESSPRTVREDSSDEGSILFEHDVVTAFGGAFKHEDFVNSVESSPRTVREDSFDEISLEDLDNHEEFVSGVESSTAIVRAKLDDPFLL